MAPRHGFEPRTVRLTAECSTAELPGNKNIKALKSASFPKLLIDFMPSNVTTIYTYLQLFMPI